MSEHDDDLDYGIPFWAYSDDEDLADVRGDLAMPSWDEPIVGPDGLGLSDDQEAEAAFRGEWAETVAPSRQPVSRAAVERLLDRPSLSWTGCRGAVETAFNLGAWDLVEQAAIRALRVAHDDNYKPSGSLGLVARQVLVAKCAIATPAGLATALSDGQARLKAVVDDARREGRTALADAVDGEVLLASKMLLLLGQPQ